jgi:hypothetical protein
MHKLFSSEALDLWLHYVSISVFPFGLNGWKEIFPNSPFVSPGFYKSFLPIYLETGVNKAGN